MMKTIPPKLRSTAMALAAHALMLAGPTAQAGSFDAVNGIDLGEIDVRLGLRDSVTPGYAYDFVFCNDLDRGSITGIYFEEDWFRKLKSVGTPFGPASYYPASLIPDVADWDGPMGSHTVANTDAGDSVLAHGVQPGQTQLVSFVTDTSKVALQDLIDKVGLPGYGIAIRVQDRSDQDPQAASWGLAGSAELDIVVGGAGQLPPENTVSTPTPTAFLTGAALGLAGLCRRRRR